jgi:GT2 family glycosyltransferase
MNVSIIIVNYNTSNLLKDCLYSVMEKTQLIEYEIIIVDNNSSDDSVTMLTQQFPNVILVKSEINLGFGKANNQGYLYAKGKYLFLLNTDTLLINNAIKILFDFMEDPKNTNTGSCGGNLYTKDLKPNYSYSTKYPSLFNIITYRSQISFLFKKEDNFNNSPICKEVAIIIGADLFIKKQVFEELKGFDPAYFMYIEDGDLAYRVKKLGYKNISVPAAKIIHLQGKSSTTGMKLKMEYDGYLIYFKKNNSLVYVKIYRLLELAFAIIKYCLFYMLFNKEKRNAYSSFIKYIINSNV